MNSLGSDQNGRRVGKDGQGREQVSESLAREGLKTRSQLAQFLQMSPRSVSRLVSANRIPSIRITHQALRFNLNHVLQALR